MAEGNYKGVMLCNRPADSAPGRAAEPGAPPLHRPRHNMNINLSDGTR